MKLKISLFNLDPFYFLFEKVLEYNSEIQRYWLYLSKVNTEIYS